MNLGDSLNFNSGKTQKERIMAYGKGMKKDKMHKGKMHKGKKSSGKDMMGMRGMSKRKKK